MFLRKRHKDFNITWPIQGVSVNILHPYNHEFYQPSYAFWKSHWSFAKCTTNGLDILAYCLRFFIEESPYTQFFNAKITNLQAKRADLVYNAIR